MAQYWITSYLVYDPSIVTPLTVDQIVDRVKKEQTTLVGSQAIAAKVLRKLGCTEEQIVDRIHYAIHGLPQGTHVSI
jgi:hypothetical protein